MKVKSIVEDGLNIFAIVEHDGERRRFRLSRRSGVVSAFEVDSTGKPAWGALPSRAAQKVRRAINSQRAEITLEDLPAAPEKSRAVRPGSAISVEPKETPAAVTPVWMSAIPAQLRDLTTPESAIPLPIRLNLMQLSRAETF